MVLNVTKPEQKSNKLIGLESCGNNEGVNNQLDGWLLVNNLWDEFIYFYSIILYYDILTKEETIQLERTLQYAIKLYYSNIHLLSQ